MAEAATAAGGQDVFVHDMNLDGQLDILIRSSSIVNIYNRNASNNGYEAAIGLSTGFIDDINAADLNEDGYPDVIVSNQVILSDGAGGFNSAVTLVVSPS